MKLFTTMFVNSGTIPIGYEVKKEKIEIRVKYSLFNNRR